MKRFISIFMALLLLAMPLTACKNKPAGDESGAPAKDDNKSAQYDTLANIKANTPATFKKEMGNIVFDGQILGPGSDKCYDLTFKLSNDIYHNRYQDLKNFFIDNYSAEFEQGSEAENRYRSEDQILVTSNVNGAFCYQNLYYAYKDAEINAEEVHPDNWVEMTRFYLGETPSDTEYVMIDGTKLSMKKAAQQVNEIIDSVMEKYETEYDFSIRSGYVRQKEGSDYYTINFIVSSSYDGITLDPKVYVNKCNEAVGNVTRFSRQSSFWIPSANGFKTWSIISDGRICNVTDKKPLPDKFITFESALELLRREITAIDDITLNKAEFCYVMYFKGNVPDIDEFKKVKEYYAHPMWTFTSSIPDEEWSLENQRDSNEVERIYTVDAVTGDVAIYYEHVSSR